MHGVEGQGAASRQPSACSSLLSLYEPMRRCICTFRTVGRAGLRMGRVAPGSRVNVPRAAHKHAASITAGMSRLFGSGAPARSCQQAKYSNTSRPGSGSCLLRPGARLGELPPMPGCAMKALCRTQAPSSRQPSAAWTLHGVSLHARDPAPSRPHLPVLETTLACTDLRLWPLYADRPARPAPGFG